jgi:hypothetical protein
MGAQPIGLWKAKKLLVLHLDDCDPGPLCVWTNEPVAGDKVPVHIKGLLPGQHVKGIQSTFHIQMRVSPQWIEKQAAHKRGTTWFLRIFGPVLIAAGLAPAIWAWLAGENAPPDAFIFVMLGVAAMIVGAVLGLIGLMFPFFTIGVPGFDNYVQANVICPDERIAFVYHSHSKYLEQLPEWPGKPLGDYL